MFWQWWRGEMRKKEKLLHLLENSESLANAMIKSTSFYPFKTLEKYISSDNYQVENQKISNIKDIRLREKKLLTLNSKLCWLYRFIKEDGSLDFSLFENRENELMEDEQLIKIFHIMVQKVSEFTACLKMNIQQSNKNAPLNKKKEDLNTIKNFQTLLNRLSLGGTIIISNDKEKKQFNLNDLRIFLNELEEEISTINGNKKQSFIEPFKLGINHKYYKPKEDGLRIALINNLSNICECTKDNLDVKVREIIDFLNQENYLF